MEHNGCRIREFAMWPRLVLEHEREHISRCMAGRAFKSQEEIDGLLHDLADIDAILTSLPPRVRVKSPNRATYETS